MKESRPPRLVYQTRDGIHSTYVPAIDAGLRDLYEYLNSALDWGEPRQYAILDTFMSDSMPVDLFEQLLRRSTADGPLRLLLANPLSNFAVARGSSIGQDFLLESCRGMGRVLQALDRVGRRPARGRERIPDGTERQIEHVLNVLDLIRAHECGELVDVRFYEDAPSGPLYFFGDIVACGRFAARDSSVRMPWSMIVNHPHYEDDHFDALRNEFEQLWKAAFREIGTPAGRRGVFVSYAVEDHALAVRLHGHLAKKLPTYMADRHLEKGGNWREALRLNLSSHSALVALLTPTACRSEWVRIEIAGAWALGKRIVPIMAGVGDHDIPEPGAGYQGIELYEDADLDEAFAALASDLSRPHA